MVVLHIAAVAIGLPAVVFVFGWTVLARCTNLDGAERWVASWGVGFAVLAASQFLAFVAHADQTLCNGSTVLLMLGAACLFAAQTPRRASANSRYWPLPLLVSGGYLYLLCLQALLPIYVGAEWYGDWMMHYENALIFRGARSVDTLWIGTYSLASRTPLFNLTAAFVMSLAGDAFWTYQIASTLLNYVFVAALYLVLRDLFGAAPARLTLLLAPLNIWLMHNAWFTWPKLLAAYYALLGLHFYIQFVQQRHSHPPAARHCFFFFWTSSLLAFMTHQVALVYLAGLMLHAVFLGCRERRLWLGFKDVIGLGIILVVVVGPWYAWLACTFGSGHIGGSTPVTLMEEGASFGPWQVLRYMVHNAFTSVVPVHLWRLLGQGASFAEWYNAATQLYFSLFTGALTLSLTVFLVTKGGGRIARLLAVPDRPRDGHPMYAEWSSAWCFGVGGVLGGLALHPAHSNHGVAHAALFPAVILFVGLAWGLLAHAPRRWRLLVAAGVVGEGLFMLWSHLWLVETPEFLDPTDLNMREKERFAAVFLYDVLGPYEAGIVAAAALLQLLFCVVLVRWLCQDEVLRD